MIVCDLQVFVQLYWWRVRWCLTGEGSCTLTSSTALACKTSEFTLPWQKESFRPNSNLCAFMKHFQNHGKEHPDGWEKNWHRTWLTALASCLVWTYPNCPSVALLTLSCVSLNARTAMPSCSLPLQKSTLSFLVFLFQLFIALVILTGSPAQAGRGSL